MLLNHPVCSILYGCPRPVTDFPNIIYLSSHHPEVGITVSVVLRTLRGYVVNLSKPFPVGSLIVVSLAGSTTDNDPMWLQPGVYFLSSLSSAYQHGSTQVFTPSLETWLPEPMLTGVLPTSLVILLR